MRRFIENTPVSDIEGTPAEPGAAGWYLRASVLTARDARFFAVHDEDGRRFLVHEPWLEGALPVTRLWLIPQAAARRAVCLTSAFPLAVEKSGGALLIRCREAQLELHERFPRADALGRRFDVSVPGCEDWNEPLAAFYWDTMLPCVLENASAQYPEGYVLSCMDTSIYGGTAPDVDHEFQCKGRVAAGGGLDIELVRRMLELQCRLMREDPVGLYRNPCALQPDGTREYHVRRSSQDKSVNAEMFLISGNVEVLESAWLYVAATKDDAWLRRRMDDLEGAASLIEGQIDRYGRLWSDVFYEDQVIKDGMECMSAALAAHAFGLLAALEDRLGRTERAERFRGLEQTLGRMLRRPAPLGFWDGKNRRFIDWLDRDGAVHDHLHLLANNLPVLFGYCDAEQAEAVRALIESELEEYQRFPTFLSARTQDYTRGEIGSSAYDLAATGRHWCWDAAYWHHLRNGEMIARQLDAVSRQAREDHYRMGERYDMNYLYFIGDRKWHGAGHYYEYPCVFWWVLVHEYLGIRPVLDADIFLQPLVPDGASVTLEPHGIAYRREGSSLRVRNLAEKPLHLEAELSGMGGGEGIRRLLLPPGGEAVLSWEESL